MTVQSTGRDVGSHYAFCVRCSWASPRTSYSVAKFTASKPDSHECERKK